MNPRTRFWLLVGSGLLLVVLGSTALFGSVANVAVVAGIILLGLALGPRIMAWFDRQHHGSGRSRRGAVPLSVLGLLLALGAIAYGGYWAFQGEWGGLALAVVAFLGVLFLTSRRRAGRGQ